MPNRRLDPPLLGLLDEAPSIAPVPSLPELLADGRGQGDRDRIRHAVVFSGGDAVGRAASRDHGQRNVHNGSARGPHFPDRPGRLGTDMRPTASAPGLHPPRGTGGGAAEIIHGPSVGKAKTVLRADQIRTLQAGMAFVLWSRLPPVLAPFALAFRAARLGASPPGGGTGSIGQRPRPFARPAPANAAIPRGGVLPGGELFPRRRSITDRPVPGPRHLPQLVPRSIEPQRKKADK